MGTGKLSKLTGILGMYAAMAAMSDPTNSMYRTARESEPRPSKKSTKEIFKYTFVIPKGAKLYLFEHDGTFESYKFFANRNEMPNYCVFYCIARTDESAIKKFNSFKSE
jgi:hypothetical protein